MNEARVWSSLSELLDYVTIIYGLHQDNTPLPGSIVLLGPPKSELDEDDREKLRLPGNIIA